MQEVDDTTQKLLQTQTMQMTFCFWQVHLPKANPSCIIWSRQQVALASMWMQTKWSTCFNQKENTSTLNCASLQLADKLTYLKSSISSNENDINMWPAKAWTAIYRLSIIWKRDLSDKIKCNFFQAVVLSILWYGCITSMQTKQIEKRLDRNSTRILQAISNKSWKQNPTKQQYSHIPSVSKTIQIRQMRHVEHCWKSNENLISKILLWAPSLRHANVGRWTRTYLQQLCTDTGCSPQDLLEAIHDWDEWQWNVGEICTSSTT